MERRIAMLILNQTTMKLEGEPNFMYLVGKRVGFTLSCFINLTFFSKDESEEVESYNPNTNDDDDSFLSLPAFPPRPNPSTTNNTNDITKSKNEVIPTTTVVGTEKSTQSKVQSAEKRSTAKEEENQNGEDKEEIDVDVEPSQNSSPDSPTMVDSNRIPAAPSKSEPVEQPAKNQQHRDGNQTPRRQIAIKEQEINHQEKRADTNKEKPQPQQERKVEPTKEKEQQPQRRVPQQPVGERQQPTPKPQTQNTPAPKQEASIPPAYKDLPELLELRMDRINPDIDQVKSDVLKKLNKDFEDGGMTIDQGATEPEVIKHLWNFWVSLCFSMLEIGKDTDLKSAEVTNTAMKEKIKHDILNFMKKGACFARERIYAVFQNRLTELKENIKTSLINEAEHDEELAGQEGAFASNYLIVDMFKCTVVKSNLPHQSPSHSILSSGEEDISKPYCSVSGERWGLLEPSKSYPIIKFVIGDEITVHAFQREEYHKSVNRILSLLAFPMTVTGIAKKFTDSLTKLNTAAKIHAILNNGRPEFKSILYRFIYLCSVVFNVVMVYQDDMEEVRKEDEEGESLVESEGGVEIDQDEEETDQQEE
jgi:hypothetical protein